MFCLALFMLTIECLGVTACGSGTVRSPFAGDAGSETGAAGAAGAADDEGGLNVGIDVGDPTLGGPCEDDAQCDDDISCTSDHCDQTLQRCRHSPDDTQCLDKVYCNGEEVCDPKLGCRAGPAVSCADSDPCTIDTCVEDTQSCSRVPRDADGDGDPIWNCAGGGDCNDLDPSISSLAKEVCNNKKDDNCDGRVDEKDCVSPAYDICTAALTITASGVTSLSFVATTLDYPTRCAPAGERGVGDVVVVLEVPKGPAQNIDVVAQSEGAMVSLASAPNCGDIAGVQCASRVPVPSGSLSRLRLYGLQPGRHILYVAGSVAAEVSLSVTYSSASVPPSNETCGTAAVLEPGESQAVSLVNALTDLTSACDNKPAVPPNPVPRPSQITIPVPPVWSSGELVYSFTLAEPRDVKLFARPLDDFGLPRLSLRTAPCSTANSELSCRNGDPTSSLFARALPAGTYYVSVSASGPSDVEVRLEDSAASDPSADEGCSGVPALSPGETIDLTLADHPDSVDLGCLVGAPDSTHSLTLQVTSDVLLVERISDNDTGAVSLALPTCAADTRLSCGTSNSSPVRARAYGVAAGTYRAVAESAGGTPATLTAFTRNAVPPTLVPFADDCTAPFEIPGTGGRFKGSTSNAHADFSAGCDGSNQGMYGAPDQILHLALKNKSRVVLDMAGSTYQTML
ncbi:MAG: putative metal-binding motif-containing protein, partial [Polyangiaceae bacterium]